MKYIKEPSKKLPVILNREVVVAGAGPSGIIAAISSAKTGAKTILIERYASLGGNLLIGLPFLGMLDQQGKQIVKGIPEDLFSRLRRAGGADKHRSCPFHVSYTIFSPEILQKVVLEMLEEAGVEILLHTFVSDVLTINNRITHLIVESKSGRQAIAGAQFIDCTGDADLAFHSGVPYELGSPQGNLQPPTLMFWMRDVEIQMLVDYLIKHPELYKEFKFSPDHFKNNPEQFVMVGLTSLVAKMTKHNPGILKLDRAIVITSLRPNEVVINMARINRFKGADNIELTRAEIEGRKQIPVITEFFKKFVPGFENATVSKIAPFIGLRETRRIIGEYILTGEDIIECTTFDDVIGLSSYFVDIHHSNDNGFTYKFPEKAYQLPFRMIVPKTIDNLLIPGRSASGNREANAATRVMAPCMVMGHAAGAAAALSVLNNTSPRHLDVSLLQKCLKSQGAHLG